MTHLTHDVMKECKLKLLTLKHDLLNRVRAAQTEYQSFDRGTDEGDLLSAALAEHEFLTTQKKWQDLLLEIENALARMENGLFGICEETDEPIEIERLRALPWTRYSIEGAEIREALHKRFAR